MIKTELCIIMTLLKEWSEECINVKAAISGGSVEATVSLLRARPYSSGEQDQKSFPPLATCSDCTATEKEFSLFVLKKWHLVLVSD